MIIWFPFGAGCPEQAINELPVNECFGFAALAAVDHSHFALCSQFDDDRFGAVVAEHVLAFQEDGLVLLQSVEAHNALQMWLLDLYCRHLLLRLNIILIILLIRHYSLFEYSED